MERIASFTVDHRKIKPWVYISRVDGDITTYDIRMRKPNTGRVLDNITIHSIEHLFATMARNSELKDDVIYFGPMGCQTGFYLLIRNADNKKVVALIKRIFRDIAVYDGEMPGASELECGNYRNLSVEEANREAENYSEKIASLTENDLRYES